MVRILALHGVGCSGDILRAQLAPLLNVIDPSWEVVFVDGFAPSHRGPGLSPAMPGPFYSHTRGYSPAEIAEAHQHLGEVIAELGPFDGVIGFSQGGSVALSYMYQRQVDGHAPDFKFAVLMSSVVPFSEDGSYGLGAVEYLCAARQREQAATTTAQSTKAATPASSLDTNQQQPPPQPLAINLFGGDEAATREQIDAFSDCLRRTFESASKIGAVAPDYDRDFFRHNDPSLVPRVLHPSFCRERLRLPTVHVQGRRDFPFMRDMADTARELCDRRRLKPLTHAGGHHPPQSPAEVEALARAMQWAVGRYYEELQPLL